MKSKTSEHRPNCDIILNKKNLWALSLSDIENDEKSRETCSQSFTIEENFPSFFVQRKFEISKQSKQNQ
jgi:hypothetical protein